MSGAMHADQSKAAPLMLGVSGCRGILGRSLTPEVAARYAGAFGGWLRDRARQSGNLAHPVTVVLARDGRAGGEVVRHAAVAGLIGAGCRVVDLGVAMTPTVGVMVDDLDAQGGLVLTASHNPQEWNGLKCIVRESPNAHGVGAAAPSAAQATQIVDRFRAGDIGLAPWNHVGSIEQDHDAAERHVEKVLGALGQIAYIGDIRRCRFRVAVDSVNASGRVGAAALLDELGCEVAHLGDQTTGIFPHTPEPLAREPDELCRGGARARRARRLRAGPRRGPARDRRRTAPSTSARSTRWRWPPSAVLAQRAKRLPERPGERRVNLSTSRMLDDVAAAATAPASLRTPVGEANVVEA
jgi:phosphomannomutase